MNRRGFLSASSALTLASVLGDTSFVQAFTRGVTPAEAAEPSVPDPKTFSYNWLVDYAKKLAGEDFNLPQVEMPKGMEDLGYDQYRDIRVPPGARIWKDTNLQFQIDLLPAGFLFKTPVEIALVNDGNVKEIPPSLDMFTFGKLGAPKSKDTAIPFSGFRVRHAINTPDVWDEFLVFQGASYFRAVGKGQLYGLSARGLAVNTAEPGGEEFPAFRKFWIEQPKSDDISLIVNALLDSESVTGAYRFTIRPGEETVIEVQMNLFARADMDHLGFAPSTSMFLFNSTNRGQFSDYREAVHDSSGLQMLSGSGEWLWRPVTNPAALQISAFSDNSPKGFGLIQRSRKFADYEDLEAHYERRPSLWVEPLGGWGEGVVELVEIPTKWEFDDNVIAFWRPKGGLAAGQALSTAYRMRWGHGPVTPEALATVAATRIGRNEKKDRVLFVLDYTGIDADTPGLKARITASTGKIVNTVIQPNPETGSVRVSFNFDPDGTDLSELRSQLSDEKGPVSEVWLYRWTALT